MAQELLLAVDIGNTNVHMGLWDGNTWAHSWRVRSVAEKMPDEYAVLLRNFLHNAGLSFRDISGAVIGSVVPPLTLAYVELLADYVQLTPLVVTSRTHTGIRIAIDQPEQAGADRIVNTAAVAKLYPHTPAIVVDFGTATTFDVISAHGEYRGGAITTGIRLSHDALVSRAARLHKIDLVPPPDPIGGNTIHAMQSGLFLGYIAMIEGMVARIRRSMEQNGMTDGKPVMVIGTGGFAPLFKEHTDSIDLTLPELTLDGLRIIYDLNRESADSH